MYAINSSVMKIANRKIVLNYILRHPISRAELSDCTHLTRASITQIVDDLMEEGLVEETSVVGRKRYGRRLTQLELVKDAKCFIGIALCCSKYFLSIINLGGETLYQYSDTLLDREPDDVVDEMSVLLKRTFYQLNLSHDKILGIGVCAPGPLDAKKGILLNSPHLQLWHGYPFVERLKQALGFEASFCSLSNAYALDEMYFGIGREDIHSFMVLRVADSIGAGIILEDRLFVGAKGHAPEFGHISVVPNGLPCACGNRGCLEKYLSIPALLEGSSFTSWEQVIDSLDTNPQARKMLEHIALGLAHFMTNNIQLFDLEKYVLSGDLVYGGQILADRINELIRERRLCCCDSDPVVAGNPINMARIAAISAYHHFFTEA